MHRPLRWFLDALQPGVLFVRLLCRGGNTPHGQISDRVAADFPGPTVTSFGMLGLACWLKAC
jgi:hypothetical protein